MLDQRVQELSTCAKGEDRGVRYLNLFFSSNHPNMNGFFLT